MVFERTSLYLLITQVFKTCFLKIFALKRTLFKFAGVIDDPVFTMYASIARYNNIIDADARCYH
jgi:hypothetical protein